MTCEHHLPPAGCPMLGLLQVQVKRAPFSAVEGPQKTTPLCHSDGCIPCQERLATLRSTGNHRQPRRQDPVDQPVGGRNVLGDQVIDRNWIEARLQFHEHPPGNFSRWILPGLIQLGLGFVLWEWRRAVGCRLHYQNSGFLNRCSPCSEGTGVSKDSPVSLSGRDPGEKSRWVSIGAGLRSVD